MAGGNRTGRKEVAAEEEEEEEEEEEAEEEAAVAAAAEEREDGEGGAVTAVDGLNRAEAGGVTVLVTIGVHFPFTLFTPPRRLSRANTSSRTNTPFLHCHHSDPHSTSNLTRSVASLYTGHPFTVRPVRASVTSVATVCSVPV